MIHQDSLPAPVLSSDPQAVPKQLSGKTDRIRSAIAERLGKVRREKGFTQVEMAKKLKTSQSIYSRYERGELRLHAETVIQIARVLDVSPNELLGVTESGNAAADPIEHQIPKRFLRRLKGVEELTRTDQEYLLRTIDVFMNAGIEKQAKKKSKAS